MKQKTNFVNKHMINCDKNKYVLKVFDSLMMHVRVLKG
jgi:hypothetical protein